MNRVGQLESFEPDWAAPGDWAAMYRAAGLQVVPSHSPSEHQNWKRPALADWKSLQEELVPQATFDRWYAARGEHSQRLPIEIVHDRERRQEHDNHPPTMMSDEVTNPGHERSRHVGRKDDKVAIRVTPVAPTDAEFRLHEKSASIFGGSESLAEFRSCERERVD